MVPFRTFPVIMLLAITPTVASGQSPQAPELSTVKLFILMVVRPGGEAGNATEATIQVGELRVPERLVRPASIFIDDSFVGHVMPRYAEVMPTFMLPKGKHHFEIRCEGYRTYESDMTVLGNGSTQWLIARLDPSGDDETTSESDSGSTFRARRSLVPEQIEKGMKASELEHQQRVEGASDRRRSQPAPQENPPKPERSPRY